MVEKTYYINGIEKSTSELTIDDIRIMIDNYLQSGGDLSSTCFRTSNNLPNTGVVRKIVKENGYSLLEFLNTYDEYNHNFRYFNKCDYDLYVEKYKEISRNQTVVLQSYNLKNYDLPNSSWFINNCPDQSVKTWNQFTRWCGFLPNTKDKVDINNKPLISKKLIQFEKELKRPIKKCDIKVSTIGFSHYVVTELWGSITNCRKELGLMQCSQHPLKPWSYYDNKMRIALKNMYKAIQTTEFTWRNWQKYKKISLTKESFINACNREGIDINEYLNGLGFKIANHNGTGCNYVFDDGELCVSNLEYRFSKFLRDNHINYERNIKYNTFDKALEGRNFNCDYVINKISWIEICGMLKSNSDDWKNMCCHTKLEKDYYNKMILKDESLTKNKIPHLFLFPQDFDNNAFESKTFDFIYKNII